MAATIQPTLRSVLTHRKDQVNGLIEKEMPLINGYRCEYIETASDVGLAIDNAWNASDYEGILDQTIDKVDKVVADQIKQIREMVTDLQEKKSLVLVNLSSRAKQFIESLVLKGWMPKVVGLFPRYVWVVHGSFVSSASGRFKYAVSYPSTCSLEIPGHRTQQKEIKEGAVTFDVTQHISTMITLAQTRHCHFIKGTLKVQYNVRSLWTSLKTATFDLWIGIFPRGPGYISLKTTRIKDLIDSNQEEVQNEGAILLTWGHTHSFQATKFKIDFISFEGKIYEIDRPTQKDELEVTEGPTGHFSIVPNLAFYKS